MAMINILVNGEEQEVTDGTTVEGLLKALGITTAGMAVELNCEIVPRTRHAATALRENDALEIVRMVGGG